MRAASRSRGPARRRGCAAAAETTRGKEGGGGGPRAPLPPHSPPGRGAPAHWPATQPINAVARRPALLRAGGGGRRRAYLQCWPDVSGPPPRVGTATSARARRVAPDGPSAARRHPESHPGSPERGPTVRPGCRVTAARAPTPGQVAAGPRGRRRRPGLTWRGAASARSFHGCGANFHLTEAGMVRPASARAPSAPRGSRRGALRRLHGLGRTAPHPAPPGSGPPGASRRARNCFHRKQKRRHMTREEGREGKRGPGHRAGRAVEGREERREGPSGGRAGGAAGGGGTRRSGAEPLLSAGSGAAPPRYRQRLREGPRPRRAERGPGYVCRGRPAAAPRRGPRG